MGDLFKFRDCSPEQVRRLGFLYPGDKPEFIGESKEEQQFGKTLSEQIAAFRFQLKNQHKPVLKSIWNGKNDRVFKKISPLKYIAVKGLTYNDEPIIFDFVTPMSEVVKVTDVKKVIKKFVIK